MTELVLFTGLFAAAAIADGIAMRGTGLKKEMLPYYCFAAAAEAAGAYYLLHPYSESIMGLLLRALRVSG
jgi:hypothetical protein